MRDGKRVGIGNSYYRIEFAAQAEKLCALGATLPQLADFFGVDRGAICRWQRGRPEFDRAVKAGRQRAKEQIEQSLFRRAVGFTIETQKVFFPNGSRTPVVVPVEERVPPDANAALAWLRTRGFERRAGMRRQAKAKSGEAAAPKVELDLPDNGRG